MPQEISYAPLTLCCPYLLQLFHRERTIAFYSWNYPSIPWRNGMAFHPSQSAIGALRPTCHRHGGKRAIDSRESARNYHRWDLLPKNCQNILYACLEGDPAKRASMEQVFQMLSDIAKHIRGLKAEGYESLRAKLRHREGMMWGGCEKACLFCKEQSSEKC